MKSLKILILLSIGAAVVYYGAKLEASAAEMCWKPVTSAWSSFFGMPIRVCPKPQSQTNPKKDWGCPAHWPCPPWKLSQFPAPPTCGPDGVGDCSDQKKAKKKKKLLAIVPDCGGKLPPCGCPPWNCDKKKAA